MFHIFNVSFLNVNALYCVVLWLKYVFLKKKHLVNNINKAFSLKLKNAVAALN